MLLSRVENLIEEIVKDMEEQAEMFEKVLDTVKEDCRK